MTDNKKWFVLRKL